MIIRVVLALLIVAFSWSQAGAYDDHHDDFDHHHHHDEDDYDEAYLWVGVGLGAAAGLTLLGAILFPPLPPPPHLSGESQKTPPKMILDGGPTGIRIRF
jgi:hypothetical protein